MRMSTLNALTLPALMVLVTAATGVSQTSSKVMADPVGVIITNSDRVTVNGAPAERGSTVFSGNEIVTGGASAFLNLTAGGGVVSIAPGSRVKISRRQFKIIARVLEGSVTLRSRLATEVIAPDRVITSKPGNLYTVSISDSGTVVESLLDSVTVQAADGAIRTIAAKTNGAAAVIPAVQAPEPIEREPVSPVGGAFVTERCVLNGNTLMVFGVVACRGVPVRGASVSVGVQVGILLITRNMRTDARGRYKFTITNGRLPQGGTARVIARMRRRGCRRAVNSCTF